MRVFNPFARGVSRPAPLSQAMIVCRGKEFVVCLLRLRTVERRDSKHHLESRR
jgi:hypothetical protein